MVELTPDPRNSNKHTARGESQVEQSLRRNGAGRGIVAAADGTIIAGNLTAQKCVELGIPFRYVHSNGNEILVTVRDDIQPGSKRFRELSISDNRTAEVSLDWDVDVLRDDWESGVELETYWYEGELADLLAEDGALTDSEQQAIPADERVRMCVELDGPSFERWTRIRDAMLANGLVDEGAVLESAMAALEREFPSLVA